MNIEIPKSSLPSHQLPDAEFSGYYIFSDLRTGLKSKKILDTLILRESSSENSESWNFLDSERPNSDSIWCHLESTRTIDQIILPNSPELIINQTVLNTLNSGSLSPDLYTLPCRFCRSSKEINIDESYYLLYGKGLKGYDLTLPEDFTLLDGPPSWSSKFIHDPFKIIYIHRHNPNVGLYDVFLDESFEVLLSQKIVSSLLELDPSLQFDPVLFPPKK